MICRCDAVLRRAAAILMCAFSHRTAQMGQEEDDHLCGALGRPLRHLEAVQAGMRSSRYDRRDRWRVEIGEPLQGLGPSAASSTTLNPPLSEEDPGEQPHLRLVVDYEDALRDRDLRGDCHGPDPSSSRGPGRAVLQ